MELNKRKLKDYLPNTTNITRLCISSVALFLSIWVFFNPEPYWRCIIVTSSFIPVLMFLALFKRDSFELYAEKKVTDKTLHGFCGDRVNLFFPFFSVSGALALRVMTDNPTTNGWQEFVWMVPFGFIFFLMVLISIKKSDIPTSIVISVLYGTAFSLIVNRLEPVSNEVTMRGKVTRKYGGKQCCTLVVDTTQGEKHVKVGTIKYEAVNIGDSECVKEFDGYLGIRLRESIKCSSILRPANIGR